MLLALLLGALGGIEPARAGLPALCAGDCDGNGQVAIGELVRSLRIALDLRPLTDCSAADLDQDGRIDIAELHFAVTRALNGCTEIPSPTRTASPSETSTATATLTAAPSETSTATATPTAAPSETSTATATPTVTPTPSTTPTIPISFRVCGNAALEPGEACDDANQLAGDGCSPSCQSEEQPDPCAGVTPVAGTRLTAVRVAVGLRQPLYATAPPGDLERLFIVEQRGRIRILEGEVLLPDPFLDLSDRVVAGGERGLLALAFHPHYATNGTFFVSYTTTRNQATVSIISRFQVSDAANRADRDSEEIVLELPQPFTTHHGGQLAFDADGYLYLSFGDGGRGAGTQNNAQDPTLWFGKILRIDVDGATPYAIPADNPFVGPDGVRDEIWALGLRNPWRFSIDPASGDLYIGDVGEGRREEIDIVPAGGAGANFGWCCREGSLPFGGCFHAATTCPASGLVDPLLEYDHPTGCAVTGGFVYRGCALPDLRGTYFYGDYCTGFVRSFVKRDGAATDQRDWTAELTAASGEPLGAIASFGEDGRGELYVCDLGGRVFKLVPADLEPAAVQD